MTYYDVEDELESEEDVPQRLPIRNDSRLRILVDMREALQRQRIAFGNRIGALDRADDTGDHTSRDVMEWWQNHFLAAEAQANTDIKYALHDHPIYEYMRGIKGVGPLLSAQLIAQVDISRSPTVSAFWRYAGYAVINGEREKKTKGEKLRYNARLKKICYLIGMSFIKSRSPYADVYYSSKAYYEANRPDWTKLHIHNAAIRRMIKHFLTHLWLVWRELEGYETRSLYVEEYLGHEHITSPAEFGWYGNGSGR